jgi:hypothetical protein
MRPQTPRTISLGRRMALALWAVAFTLLSLQALPAGQGLPMRPAEGNCEDCKWKWLYPFWFHKNGWPKYGSALQHHTHSRMERMPICPPLGDAQFGYHEPCWRQIEVFPRCWNCDSQQSHQQLPAIPALPPQPAPNSARESSAETARPQLPAFTPANAVLDSGESLTIR